MINTRRIPLGIGRSLRVLPAAPPRWRDHVWMAERCLFIIQVYYLLTLAKLYSWGPLYVRFDGSPEEMFLLWPLAWLPEGAQLHDALSFLSIASQVVGVLGLLFWRLFIVRLLVCVALLQQLTFFNVGGTFNHGHHEWFWLSVVFLFLPGGLWRRAEADLTRQQRVSVMTVFAGAGGLILMFYTLSGYYKLREMVLAEWHGLYSALQLDAMAQTVGRRMFDTMSSPPLAEMLLNYPALGWPMYMLLYYVEIFAFFAIFRPVLLQLFGVILIAFHIGTFLFLEITFPDHIIINGLFMLFSPLVPHPSRAGIRNIILALPVFGDVLRLMIRMAGRPRRVSAAQEV